jgi:hypothetical protein
MGLFDGIGTAPLIAYAVVILISAVIAVVSFAFLIPLDSVQAVTGVSTILAVAYVLSIAAWAIVMYYYSSDAASMQWLNTHVLFLVVLPATIGATAMNVTSIQNTRNMLAGQVTA